MNAAELLAAREAARESALWAELRQHGAPAAREALFDLHLAFARRIARRQFQDLSGGTIEIADLLQLACAGLLEAIDRFDPARGVPFEGYAARRISGTVLDGIAHGSEVQEQMSFRRRIRGERFRAFAVDADVERLSTPEATAALADMTIGLALGFILEGTGMFGDATTRDMRANPYESTAWKETAARLVGEVAALDGRERSIIHHHYGEGLNLDVITALLGLSKARTSRIHRAALTTLLKRLSARQRFSFEG